MRSQTRIPFVIIVLFSIMSSSCASINPPDETPTEAAIVSIPTDLPQQTDTPLPPTESISSTFVDQNNLFAIDLPADWTHATESQSDHYTDTFTPPDSSAKIGSLIYNDGQPFEEAKNKDFALYLLNTYYSSTGKAGDIIINSDQMMENGTQRNEWNSKGGGYSGVSFFELRGDDKATFLMFTAQWKDGTDQATLDIVNQIIATIRVP
jgi:hypothetical protein